MPEVDSNVSLDLSTPEKVVEAIEQKRAAHPENRMARHFPVDVFLGLSPEKQQEVVRIVRAGLENEDSEVGAYAMQPTDYTEFEAFLGPIVRDYHNVSKDMVQTSDWDRKGETMDLRDADPSLTDVSMRMRVARNVDGWPMTGSMTQADRVNFEKYMVETAFEKMMKDPRYGGRYVSLTPGSPYEVSKAEYDQLVAEHKMFKDMSADPHLKAAGISNDWPYGRGMYISADEKTIVWVGEEDQLRIMFMEKGSDLGHVLDSLHEELEFIERICGVPFARDPKLGYVTSCPSNMGTGARVSLHLKLPILTDAGEGQKTDKNLKAKAKALGLNVSIRGSGGEHTPIDAEGTVDVSPRRRLGVTEVELAKELADAAKALLAAERELREAQVA